MHMIIIIDKKLQLVIKSNDLISQPCQISVGIVESKGTILTGQRSNIVVSE